MVHLNIQFLQLLHQHQLQELQLDLLLPQVQLQHRLIFIVNLQKILARNRALAQRKRKKLQLQLQPQQQQPQMQPKRKVKKANMNTTTKTNGKRKKLLPQHLHLRLLNQQHLLYLIEKRVLEALLHTTAATQLGALVIHQLEDRIMQILRHPHHTQVDFLQQNHHQLSLK